MRERLEPVRLFGKNYYWWREKPGQPLQLVPHVPLSEPPVPSQEDLYESALRMMGGRLPWPFEEQPDA